MGRIVVLDEVTAGRIAAGEVVERPASVVKELVENAFDAQATRVEVELVDGGRALVKVADNGEGMDAADAVLAFERHATSKLAQPGDLEAIGTYGFRGEALPSIGAVSRVRLVTCRAGLPEGAEVSVEGGRLTGEGPGPAREGTVVWVRDLFFNTPARREALRSARAETARISETLGTLALARPDVAVRLADDGEVLWSTPGSGRLEDAVAGLLGPAFVRETVPVAGQTGNAAVTGLAGLPTVARRDGKRQYLFCNRRPINPRILRSAVDEAYRGLLESGRTPLFILNLELPAREVDVNIHPSKTYVRFRDHGLVHRAVLAALRAAFSPADLFAGRLGGRFVAAGQSGESAVAEAARPGMAVPADWRGLFGADRGKTPDPGGPAPVAPAPRVSLEALEPVAQVGRLFIAATGPDGLYLVDQHAADERVTYESLLGTLAGPPAVQPLAVPETVELAPGEEAVLEDCLGFLREAGFEVEPFGPRAIAVRAMPAALVGVPLRALLSDFLDRYATGGHPQAAAGVGSFDRTRAARIMAACKSALKAGQALSLPEMRALLMALAACAEPRTCPHGRPTVLRLGLEELRRAFSRSKDTR